MRNKFAKIIFFMFLLLSASSVSAQQQRSADIALAQEKVSAILDQWTVLRWGQDSVVWIVHYPEELVDPYVRLETLRMNLTAEQSAAYRQAFRDELRMGKAKAFMFSVHVFGDKPVSMGPLSQTLLLTESSGTSYRPLSYEKKLDAPVGRFVQGFVFFKPFKDRNFKISIKNLIPGRESIFIFNASYDMMPKTIATQQSSQNPPKTTNKSTQLLRKKPRVEIKEPEVLIKIPINTKPIAPNKPAVPKE